MLHIRPLDFDLTQLQACSVLQDLHIYTSPHITGDLLLQLAAALPSLVLVMAIKCRLVLEHHRESLDLMMAKRRIMSWNIGVKVAEFKDVLLKNLSAYIVFFDSQTCLSG